MKKTIFYLMCAAIFTTASVNLHAQTGNYSQTLSNMQSVYSATTVTFTNTPDNATSGTLSCSWLGCQDVGIGNPYFKVDIWTNGSWQQLAQHNAYSNCGFVNFSQAVSAQTINSAIASGSGSILMRVVVIDYCPSGWGCSCCNDPYINGLKLEYAYSKAAFNASSTSICPAQTISFTDTTPATVISRTWYFPGGTPSTATSANPVVTYTTPGTYDVSLVTVSANGTDSSTKVNYVTVLSPPAATVSPAGPTTFCSGSSVLISANTGPGLTYQWKKNSSIISGATASTYSAKLTGSYSAIVTGSNGCTNVSAAIAVTNNPLPNAILTAGGATTFCPGGSVLLSATTGNGYTYVWKKGSSIISGATSSTYAATASGSFKVIITNGNGCARTSNIIPVTVNTPVASITAQGPTTFCNGGGVTLQANTGSGLTYVWKLNGTVINNAISPSYTAYTTGSYRAVVTNSCGSKTSNTILVTVNPIPIASIHASGSTTFCNGSSVTLAVDTASGSTYKWRKNNTTILNATAVTYDASATGSYTAEVTNAFGCTNISNAISVVVNTTAASVSANGPTTFCNGDSVVLNANTGANLTYQWLKNNANISGANGASYTAKTSGAYKVIVTNTLTSCAKTSGAVQIVVNCKLASAEPFQIKVAPNPFSGSTTVELLNEGKLPVVLNVYNEEGKLIEKHEAPAGENQIMLGNKWQPGVYIIKIHQNKKEKIIKLVKKD